MRKRIGRFARFFLSFLFFIVAMCPFQIFAQVTKVAVWGPSEKQGSEEVDAIELSIINNRFRDAVSGMSGIELISRTDVDNILNELEFQQNGMVSENDKKLLGQMKGVDLIVSLMVAKGHGYVDIASSFIDVEEANVVGRTQSVLALANNPLDLAEKCVELAGKLTGVTSTTVVAPPVFYAGETDIFFRVGDITFKMLFVKGGTFQMGSNLGKDDEKPVHDVTVSDFYLGEYEVTQALWQEVMGTNIYQQQKKSNGGRPIQCVGDDYPMCYVNYVEAEEFCKRLNQRLHRELPSEYSFSLPTEAEWEYAAKGGNKSESYIYSGSNYLSDVGWNSGGVHTVGSKKANELGLYDMSGNVWEWCSDWYGNYNNSSQTNPQGASSGTCRVYRGGSWYSASLGCRVADRNFGGPNFRDDGSGFRLALVRR